MRAGGYGRNPAGGIRQATSEEEADRDAIRAVIQLYFDGIIQYDEAALRKAFHPKASVISTTSDGAQEWEPFQEWVVYTRGDARNTQTRQTQSCPST